MINYFNRLIVLECANNHLGSVELAKEIIKIAKEQCEPYKDTFQFGIKLQYRDLDTFIHPYFKHNVDFKYIKRFNDTRLSWERFKEIKDYIKECGFISICTPFDENSVDKIIEHNYDIIKIASCSFTDWSLIEKIAVTNKHIIASTGAAELLDIDNFVSFMKHRKKEFALLHCVPEYPTQWENGQLGQIEFLKNRYKDISIGYSSHIEHGSFDIRANILEVHIKLNDGNKYSISPIELKVLLENYKNSILLSGYETRRYEIPETQKQTIRNLQRGVYAKEDLKAGDILTKENTFLAMPVQGTQHLTTSDLSKYKEYKVKYEIGKNLQVTKNMIDCNNKRQDVLDIIKQIVPIIKNSKVAIPDNCDMELSHHYGISRYKEYGAAIFNILNREYAKKIIVILPNQIHPDHYHIQKDETFHVLYGDLTTNINGEIRTTNPTDDNLVIVERKKVHFFTACNGCVFEEISTTSIEGDSYYDDERIINNPNRKTKMTFKRSWLDGEIT